MHASAHGKETLLRRCSSIANTMAASFKLRQPEAAKSNAKGDSASKSLLYRFSSLGLQVGSPGLKATPNKADGDMFESGGAGCRQAGKWHQAPRE